MLSKKLVNTILNNKYNAVKFIETEGVVKLTHKQSFFSFKKNIQTLQFFEVKNICLQYAKNNNIELISNNDFKEWFKMFEIEFNKNKKDK